MTRFQRLENRKSTKLTVQELDQCYLKQMMKYIVTVICEYSDSLMSFGNRTLHSYIISSMHNLGPIMAKADKPRCDAILQKYWSLNCKTVKVRDRSKDQNIVTDLQWLWIHATQYCNGKCNTKHKQKQHWGGIGKNQSLII